MKRLYLLMPLLLLAASAFAKVKVACVGNSITYGLKIADRERNSYPAQLARLLGDDYEVGNFGHSGATLMEKGFNPYISHPEYVAALEFNPDIVVIHLGINDTDPRTWPNFNDNFTADYIRLIDSFRQRNPKLRVLVARLTPIRSSHKRYRSGTWKWRLDAQKRIADVAEASGCELIDFDAPLRDRQNLLPDGLHPNAEGAALLAETVRGAITGDYGGLKLPEIWQSGMVVQRDRPLTVRGRADAHSNIILKLDGRTYRTKTDNRGDWHITTAPLATGPVYEMTVTDGKDSIRLTDILAGEVWLASGQSNMEFLLNSSIDAAEATAAATDTLLRMYNCKAVARTDGTAWSDSIRSLVNRLDYFKPTRWQTVDPRNSRWLSAVAYHFARRLREELQVPVGIICNAVGGSPAESWIDVNTLEAGMPEILVDWQTNDYLQPWVQFRAAQNVGKEQWNRHPYEPSYLFGAGIRPLAGFPVAGTIWYQGESNAHNIELHEQLFPMLVDSWRREFGNPDMPFYFVQLSSIDRPSWPEFRDSQRRLALSVPNTAMAVSSDLGDSLNVHPRNKRPVGERLARIALRRHYGKDNIVDQGPALRRAYIEDAKVVLLMDNAESGLTTSDSNAPLVFEVAEYDGLYYPATATIEGGKIILGGFPDDIRPRFVRYAWQPFTRSNLVNGAGLPASTFKAVIDNASDYDCESGFELGVSAPFSTYGNGRMIVAGGCNFPVDPLGADSKKRYYSGIYIIDSLGCERIGSLPRQLAYGVSANTGKGTVFAGGIGPDGTSRSVWLYSGGKLTELPQLPCSIDNAAAAAVGNTVYICAGNADGKPSKALYALNLDSNKPQWKELRSMPGKARVQPVMAASGYCLYLWGGFSVSAKGKASVESGGLCYDTRSGKWSTLPSPTDRKGNPLTLSGGAACTLSDGRIALCGGVNKDVFKKALTEPEPDYLLQPVDYYRFNRKVLLFDPVSGKYDLIAESADAARAGAAIFPDGENGFTLYGGELKPRIRTAQTVSIRIGKGS